MKNTQVEEVFCLFLVASEIKLGQWEEATGGCLGLSTRTCSLCFGTWEAARTLLWDPRSIWAGDHRAWWSPASHITFSCPRGQFLHVTLRPLWAWESDVFAFSANIGFLSAHTSVSQSAMCIGDDWGGLAITQTDSFYFNICIYLLMHIRKTKLAHHNFINII